MSFNALKCPPMFSSSNVEKNNRTTHHRTRSTPNINMSLSSTQLQSEKSSRQTRFQASNHLLAHENTVGIIGGVSVFSTLVFLEKLVWWSSREKQDFIPFVVCSDPSISRDFPNPIHPLSSPINGMSSPVSLNRRKLVEKLKGKREFLEKSGARCIVMPCNLSQAWLVEVSEGCSVPFLNVVDCLAMELKEANLKPLEAGSSEVRIGVISSDTSVMADFYYEKLQSQGFEVVLLDKATMEHTIIPAIEALNKKDMAGARNLLRIAIQVLLVRAVNYVVLASDEFHSLLPGDDPLLKRCINPMDVLARSTIKWAQSTTVNLRNGMNNTIH